jgi:hypothetical protein
VLPERPEAAWVVVADLFCRKRTSSMQTGQRSNISFYLKTYHQIFSIESREIGLAK